MDPKILMLAKAKKRNVAVAAAVRLSVQFELHYLPLDIYEGILGLRRSRSSRSSRSRDGGEGGVRRYQDWKSCWQQQPQQSVEIFGFMLRENS